MPVEEPVTEGDGLGREENPHSQREISRGCPDTGGAQNYQETVLPPDPRQP